MESIVREPASDGDLRFLDPRVFARLENLELVARFIVEGFMLGLHRSPYHGFSVEFSSYRKYSTGDNLKFVDWKLYGRTDRHYVKQFEENTNLSCYLLLDRSGSMALECEGVSKLRYGACLAAALAYLMLKQRDAVALATFDSTGIDFIHPSAKQIQLGYILRALQGARPGRETDFASGLNRVASRITRRGLVIIISDFLVDPGEVLPILKYLRYKKHEVILFQLLAPVEIDFPFLDQCEFIDAETGEKLVTSARLVRSEYIQALKQHNETIRNACLDLEVEYLLLRTDQQVAEALVSYISSRSRCF